MKRQGNKSANYLDLIPLHCASLRCTVDEMGNVTLFQENKGVFHFLPQKIKDYEVTDCSSNGTYVAETGQRLKYGVPTHLPCGTVIELGDLSNSFMIN